ncbi:ParA family protein, partial [Escherichia coli]
RNDPALSVAVCDSAGQLALEAEKMDDSCDVVVIDMPPRSLKFLREALAFSDLVLMPLSSSPADVWAAEQLVDMVREARKTSKRLTARLLWNRV